MLGEFYEHQLGQTHGDIFERQATNIIWASVLLDMSTPDKMRVAENLDCRTNWRSSSINSCFLDWEKVHCFESQGSKVGGNTDVTRTTNTGDRC